MPSPHTAEALSNELAKCLLDWNVDRRLYTITIDNCSTNDAMIPLLLAKFPSGSLLLNGKLLHMSRDGNGEGREGDQSPRTHPLYFVYVSVPVIIT